jgi:hypothetical protein
MEIPPGSHKNYHHNACELASRYSGRPTFGPPMKTSPMRRIRFYATRLTPPRALVFGELRWQSALTKARTLFEGNHSGPGSVILRCVGA